MRLASSKIVAATVLTPVPQLCPIAEPFREVIAGVARVKTRRAITAAPVSCKKDRTILVWCGLCSTAPARLRCWYRAQLLHHSHLVELFVKFRHLTAHNMQDVFCSFISTRIALSIVMAWVISRCPIPRPRQLG
jgi:hypothetical protein